MHKKEGPNEVSHTTSKRAGETALQRVLFLDAILFLVQII